MFFLHEFEDDDPAGWVIKARGKEYTPQRKMTMSLLGYCEKDRTYAYLPYALATLLGVAAKSKRRCYYEELRDIVYHQERYR